MALLSELRSEVDNMVRNGVVISFSYYIGSYYADSYDNAGSVYKSGNTLYCSGLFFPISNTKGSNDAVFLQQGLIKTDDRKIYLNGSVVTSGRLKIGIGSPSSVFYTLSDAGAVSHDIEGDSVYKCLYVKFLPLGSLYGE